MRIDIFALGLLLGLVFAAPPGAVTVETLRRGARGGFGLALGVQLGSLVGDGTYALLALARLAAIAQIPAVQIILSVFSALFLMRLAWLSFNSSRTPMSPLPSSDRNWRMREARRLGEWSKVNAFLSGLTISLTNPWAIAFWLSLGGVMSAYGLAHAGPQQTAFFFASFMLGSTLWALTLSIAIARVQRWMSPKISRVVSVTCGIFLAAFGLAGTSRMITGLWGL